MSITVVNPQVQHSYQVAVALIEGGLLENYVTSFFFRPDQISYLPHFLRQEFAKRFHPQIPTDKVVTFPYIELAWKLAGKLVTPALHERLFYYNVWGFDALMARRVAKSPGHIVVGYENSCRETFKAAKKTGKYCVLDAASIHYLSQKEVYRPPYSERFLARINAVKEEEINLADHILALSNYAKESYIQAGVPGKKITVIPLGIDIDKFTKHKKEKKGDYFTYLFAGNLKLSKGVDILLDAFSKVEVPNKRLTIIGAMGDAAPLLKKRLSKVIVKKHMPQEKLLEEYHDADIFVLPSRLDGFGFVVAEAMSTATPVIVSSHVGAKDLVEDDINGWVFESGNSDALTAAMQKAFDDRNNLGLMGGNARKTVSRYTWETYRENIRNFYSGLLDHLK